MLKPTVETAQETPTVTTVEGDAPVVAAPVVAADLSSEDKVAQLKQRLESKYRRTKGEAAEDAPSAGLRRRARPVVRSWKRADVSTSVPACADAEAAAEAPPSIQSLYVDVEPTTFNAGTTPFPQKKSFFDQWLAESKADGDSDEEEEDTFVRVTSESATDQVAQRSRQGCPLFDLP